MTDEKKTTVKFIKPHRHRGQQYKAGDSLEVSAREKEKLKKFGVIG